MKRRTALVLALGLFAACGREPAPQPTFTPPADGRLTEAQVHRYLRNTQDKLSPQEVDWVRARVREARLAGTAGALDRRVVESRRRILRSLEDRRRSLSDPARKAETDRRIAEVRRLLADAPPEPAPSIRYNIDLVARLETPEKPGKETP